MAVDVAVEVPVGEAVGVTVPVGRCVGSGGSARRPGSTRHGTPRREDDRVAFLAGLYQDDHERLLVIERAIDAGDPAGAFALHSRWQAQRRGVLGLVREYLTSAIRPTVVFPYLVLLVLLWLFYA